MPEADWHWQAAEPPEPNVTVAENPEVGRLYGPDGALVAIVHARTEHPIGFRPDRPGRPGRPPSERGPDRAR